MPETVAFTIPDVTTTVTRQEPTLEEKVDEIWHMMKDIQENIGPIVEKIASGGIMSLLMGKK